jgi:hypothetical protein
MGEGEGVEFQGTGEHEDLSFDDHQAEVEQFLHGCLIQFH